MSICFALFPYRNGCIDGNFFSSVLVFIIFQTWCALCANWGSIFGIPIFRRIYPIWNRYFSQLVPIRSNTNQLEEMDRNCKSERENEPQSKASLSSEHDFGISEGSSSIDSRITGEWDSFCIWGVLSVTMLEKTSTTICETRSTLWVYAM